MMVDPMFMIVQNSSLFLTAVNPTAVASTVLILLILVISHQFRLTGMWQMMIPLYLYICVIVYLYTCDLVYLCTYRQVYLCTCVLVNL